MMLALISSLLEKKQRLKYAIRSRINFIILKRPSLTKIKKRVLIFSGSITLIVNITFNVYPAYAGPLPVNYLPQKVQISYHRDIPLEHKIRSIIKTENVFTDTVIEKNFLIEQGLIHTVEINESSTVKTEESQLKTRSSKCKKFNRKIHTIADLPKKKSDTIVIDELKSIPRYKTTSSEIQEKSQKGSSKYKKFNRKAQTLADLQGDTSIN